MASTVLVLSLGIAAAQDRKRSLILGIALGGESNFACRVMIAASRIMSVAATYTMNIVVDGGVDGNTGVTNCTNGMLDF